MSLHMAQGQLSSGKPQAAPVPKNISSRLLENVVWSTIQLLLLHLLFIPYSNRVVSITIILHQVRFMAQYLETCDAIKKPCGRQDAARIIGYKENMVTLSVSWYKISDIINRFAVPPKGKDLLVFVCWQ